MEPVNTEELEYIRIRESDQWVTGMRPEDPLAEKEFITKEDLMGKPLILPERLGVQSELANWFGEDFQKLNIAYTAIWEPTQDPAGSMDWDIQFPDGGSQILAQRSAGAEKTVSGDQGRYHYSMAQKYSLFGGSKTADSKYQGLRGIKMYSI